MGIAQRRRDCLEVDQYLVGAHGLAALLLEHIFERWVVHEVLEREAVVMDIKQSIERHDVGVGQLLEGVGLVFEMFEDRWIFSQLSVQHFYSQGYIAPL